MSHSKTKRLYFFDNLRAFIIGRLYNEVEQLIKK